MDGSRPLRVLAASAGVAGNREPEGGFSLLHRALRHGGGRLRAYGAVFLEELGGHAEGILLDAVGVGGDAVGDRPRAAGRGGEQLPERPAGARLAEADGELRPGQQSGRDLREGPAVDAEDRLPEALFDLLHDGRADGRGLRLVGGARRDAHLEFAPPGIDGDGRVLRAQDGAELFAHLLFIGAVDAHRAGHDGGVGKLRQIGHDAVLEHRDELPRVLGHHQQKLVARRQRAAGGDPAHAGEDHRLLGHHREPGDLLWHLPPGALIGLLHPLEARLVHDEAAGEPLADGLLGNAVRPGAEPAHQDDHVAAPERARDRRAQALHAGPHGGGSPHLDPAGSEFLFE